MASATLQYTSLSLGNSRCICFEGISILCCSEFYKFCQAKFTSNFCMQGVFGRGKGVEGGKGKRVKEGVRVVAVGAVKDGVEGLGSDWVGPGAVNASAHSHTHTVYTPDMHARSPAHIQTQACIMMSIPSATPPHPHRKRTAFASACTHSRMGLDSRERLQRPPLSFCRGDYISLLMP